MMPFKTLTRKRLGLLATACLLSVALPAGSAWAQKVKNKTPAATQASEPVFNVDIPGIDAVGSNVDTATLRAIFSGKIVDNAAALAGLTATSITIPTITLETSKTVDGVDQQATITFSDLVLKDVTNGNATSVSLGGMEVQAGDDASAEFGMLSANNFDIAGVLGIYGLVDAGGKTAIETIYTDFTFDGGTFTSPEVECTIGAMTVAEFKARPLKYSMVDMMAMANALESDNADPSPETLGMALRMYADIFTAFESTPSQFGGINCSGVDEDDRAMTFQIAGMTMGGMSPGIYPEIVMEGLNVNVEGDGSFMLGKVTIKEMDFSGPIAVVEAAPAALDEAWFTDNARALMPEFGGFSFGNFAIDIADSEDIDMRIKASIGAFDLTLASYLNGIPTNLEMTASNIVADLPTDEADLQPLIDMGITSIDAGFRVATRWNEADETIAIDEVSISGVDLATVKLAGTIANATSALFDINEDSALAAAMGLAVSQIKLDVNDLGLSDVLIAGLAADQGGDPATLRPVFAGLAQGTVVGMLAGAAEAQNVGMALNAFINGTAKNLMIQVTAKEQPGLGLLDFLAAEEDPTLLIGKVTIDASAN